jgi:hypothetical protein
MQSSMNDGTGAKIRSHPKQAFENKMYSRVEVYMYYNRNSLEPTNIQDFRFFTYILSEENPIFKENNAWS